MFDIALPGTHTITSRDVLIVLVIIGVLITNCALDLNTHTHTHTAHTQSKPLIHKPLSCSPHDVEKNNNDVIAFTRKIRVKNPGK